MSSDFRVFRTTIIFVALAASLPAAADETVSPEQFAAQIEADWLRQHELRFAPALTDASQPEVDAAGGVDGHIDGKWGFHTRNEKNPWWQVDLGTVTQIDRIVLYNRCDKGMNRRNDRIVVRFSEDGKTFREFYRHDGTPFLGYTDKKPLVIPVGGAKARYVRLGLEETSYFSPGRSADLRPRFERKRGAGQTGDAEQHEPMVRLAANGVPSRRISHGGNRRGAACAWRKTSSGRGVDVAEVVKTLKELQSSGANDKAAYLAAQSAIRSIALKNPLLDFDEILFVKRRPTMFPPRLRPILWLVGAAGGWGFISSRGSRKASRNCAA